MEIKIYYDGECPFCYSYLKLLRLKETVNNVSLIDVRATRNAALFLTRKGFDIDLGMVISLGENFYAGADAIHVLSGLSSSSHRFNVLNAMIFSSRIFSFLLYPFLRMGRNITLFCINKNPVKKNDSPLLQIFMICWAMFSLLHFLVYAFQFGANLYWSTWLIGALGVGLLLRPYSKKIFLILILVGSVDAWLQMPAFSNHTIIKNFLLFAFLAAGVAGLLKGSRLSEVFNDVAPVGRVLLLVMYIFGVFHKINADFMDPTVSCAVALWDAMPWPINIFRSVWLDYIFIYGTLVIETLIFVFLLIPAFRHAGIVAGIMFHMMLALSGYAMYAPFSMLSLLLHILFISPAAADRMLSSPLATAFLSFIKKPIGGIVVLLYCGALYFLAWLHNYSGVALLWFLWVLPLLSLVWRYGRDPGDKRQREIFLSRHWYMNVISVFFLFNCLSPYVGLKTAQSINMFANLRLEGGVSNHYLMPASTQYFGYLDDVVHLIDHSGSDYFSYLEMEGLSLTYYDFLNYMEKNPVGWVSYERNGILYKNVTSSDLNQEIEELLHPLWVRKWFHFYPVDLSDKKKCALNR